MEKPKTPTVAIVETYKPLRDGIRDWLLDEGYKVQEYETVDQARTALNSAQQLPDILLCGHELDATYLQPIPTGDGVKLATEFKDRPMDCVVISFHPLRAQVSKLNAKNVQYWNIDEGDFEKLMQIIRNGPHAKAIWTAASRPGVGPTTTVMSAPVIPTIDEAYSIE